MENKSSKEDENLSTLLEKYNIDMNQYIISDIGFYNRDNVVNNDNNDNLIDLICPICLNILNNPVCCSSNIHSHNFCNLCINKYLYDHNRCPICKNIFEYQVNDNIDILLEQLSFKCMFYKRGCKDIINYSDYFNHINNCQFKTEILYECQIKKYNHANKNFEKCAYKGEFKDIENHFKSCAFQKFKCIFCNEDVLQIDLEEHVEKKCRIGIINYPDGEKYIGEKKIEQEMGWAFFIIQKEIDMKENGKTTKEKDLEFIIIQMGIDMRGNGKTVYLMDMEYSFYQMEIDMRGNVKMVLLMDMELAYILVGVNIKDNIKMGKRKDMEYIPFQMEILMKENGRIMKEEDME